MVKCRYGEVINLKFKNFIKYTLTPALSLKKEREFNLLLCREKVFDMADERESYREHYNIYTEIAQEKRKTKKS